MPEWWIYYEIMYYFILSQFILITWCHTKSNTFLSWCSECLWILQQGLDIQIETVIFTSYLFRSLWKVRLVFSADVTCWKESFGFLCYYMKNSFWHLPLGLLSFNCDCINNIISWCNWLNPFSQWGRIRAQFNLLLTHNQQSHGVKDIISSQLFCMGILTFIFHTP